jgi:glycosyltransferase involved in cell wall biosynthesis
MTRFSVVISAYNQRERLLDAVESVVRQTAAAHEIIVVDDGSSDGTAEAVRLRYPLVKLVVQENRGKGIARNHGALLATGHWLCFLDHDDLWHPEKLSALGSFIEERPQAIAVDHGVWIFREDDGGPDTAWGLRVDFTARTIDEVYANIERLGAPANDFNYLQRAGDTFHASLRRIFSTTSALSVRRDAFLKAGGFNPAQANGEDWALSVNVARLGEWHTIPRALSCQRFLLGSDTTDPAGMVMILSTLAGHWYSGRPLQERSRGFEFVDELSNYGAEYRALAQAGLWSSLRRGRTAEARTVLRFGMLLLPRWRDRLHVLAPPQLTWRLGRLKRGR